MSTIVFRTDTTDYFGKGKEPRMMRLEAVVFSASGKRMGKMDVLIRPDGWVPNAGANATHGITARQCELFGVRPKIALAMFMDLFRTASEIASWPMKFHKAIIDVELRRAGASPPEWSLPGLKRTCISTETSRILNNGRTLKIDDAWNQVEIDAMPSKLEASIALLKFVREKKGAERNEG